MLVVYVITFLQFAVKYFVFWKKVKNSIQLTTHQRKEFIV